MSTTRGTWLLAALCVAAVAGLGLALPASQAFAQSEPFSKADGEALKREVEALKAEVQSLRGELKIMREYMVRGGPPQAQGSRLVSRVGVAGSPVMGKKGAPVTLVEFSNYQCPFCKQFSDTTLRALKSEYVDAGKVRYVFRDFPLDQAHPQARKAAEAAHCAGDHGKYWQAHDLLFQNQAALQLDKLKTYAGQLRLNAAAFEDCLNKSKHATRVQKGYDDGVAAGVRGTPTFFLGKSGPDDSVEGVLIVGARPITVFREAIETLLREK
jgi:protein-disulfide isomerase